MCARVLIWVFVNLFACLLVFAIGLGSCHSLVISALPVACCYICFARLFICLLVWFVIVVRSLFICLAVCQFVCLFDNRPGGLFCQLVCFVVLPNCPFARVNEHVFKLVCLPVCASSSLVVAPFCSIAAQRKEKYI